MLKWVGLDFLPFACERSPAWSQLHLTPLSSCSWDLYHTPLLLYWTGLTLGYPCLSGICSSYFLTEVIPILQGSVLVTFLQAAMLLQFPPMANIFLNKQPTKHWHRETGFQGGGLFSKLMNSLGIQQSSSSPLRAWGLFSPSSHPSKSLPFLPSLAIISRKVSLGTLAF